MLSSKRLWIRMASACHRSLRLLLARQATNRRPSTYPNLRAEWVDGNSKNNDEAGNLTGGHDEKFVLTGTRRLADREPCAPSLGRVVTTKLVRGSPHKARGLRVEWGRARHGGVFYRATTVGLLSTYGSATLYLGVGCGVLTAVAVGWRVPVGVAVAVDAEVGCGVAVPAPGCLR
jgi:hypothetical protein